MAEYCRSIFGEALLIDPLDKYPVSANRISLHCMLLLLISCSFYLFDLLFLVGVGRPSAQSSGADGENPHQEQEIT